MRTIANLSMIALLAFSTVSYGEESRTMEAFKLVPAKTLVQPEYPIAALRKGVSGYVLLEYSVDSNGQAKSIDVIKSSPEGVFDKVAIKALKRSRFEVTSVDGRDVEVTSQSKRYVFDIDQKSRAALARMN